MDFCGNIGTAAQLIQLAGGRHAQYLSAVLPHLDNARQSSNIGNLLDGRQEAADVPTCAEGLELLKDEAPEMLIHIEVPRDPHVLHKALFELPLGWADLLNMRRLLR